MTEIRYFDFSANTEFPIEFGDFVALVKGSSITSLAVGDDFIEFGLSDGYNLRIAAGSNVTLIPTTNKGDNAPIRLNVISSDEIPTAELAESRIRAVRQIYAINFLIGTGRESEIDKAFSSGTLSDLENLLDEDDKLLIKAASTGSFWLTLAAKSTAAWNSLKGIAPLFFDEGRQAVVERVRAHTELAKLDVDKKRLDIGMQRANGMIELYNKIERIKDPAVKDQMKEELSRSIIASGKTPPALPPPSDN